MNEQGSDPAVLTHIQRLVGEEHRLFERGSLDASEATRLAAVQIELDQCWDLLRQHRALRESGHPASEAHVRPANVVKKYEG